MSDEISRLSDELARDPASMAFLPLAEALRRAGNLDLASRVATRGLDRYPYLADAHAALARIAADRGDLEQALDEFAMALSIEPENAVARKGLAFIAFRQGRLELALEHLTRLAHERPDDAVLTALERVQEARAAAEEREAATRRAKAPVRTLTPPPARPAMWPGATATPAAEGALHAPAAGATELESVPAPNGTNGAHGAHGSNGAERTSGAEGSNDADSAKGTSGADSSHAAGSGTGAESADSSHAAGSGTGAESADSSNGTNGHAPAIPAIASRPRTASLTPVPTATADARALFRGIETPERQALLLDADGLVLAGRYIERGGRDVGEEIGAELAGVSGEAQRAMRFLQLGQWTSLLVESEHATVAMCPAPGNALVLVAGSRETPAGLVRLLLDRALARARKWLETLT
jgi:predicted regulator of Ras-like GTPase activity (Roadblock/LC7/MglB family)